MARAKLSVKAGGFSIGAFAASNRGKLEPRQRFRAGRVIGEGSYGSVQKCMYKEPGREPFRIFLWLRELARRNVGQKKGLETFDDERNVYLVLELCTGGELFDRIVADGKFTEQVAAYCVQQMLRAVNYMHINGIMHRDLKPENWLLAESGSAIEKTYLKLIDFGLSKRFSPGQSAATKAPGSSHLARATEAGTPYYVAPEVLAGRYNELCDVHLAEWLASLLGQRHDGSAGCSETCRAVLQTRGAGLLTCGVINSATHNDPKMAILQREGQCLDEPTYGRMICGRTDPDLPGFESFIEQRRTRS
eukprot:Skav230912  [mRNA]  locus=scaffold2578:41356:49563:- [translate_table: standard]